MKGKKETNYRIEFHSLDDIIAINQCRVHSGIAKLYKHSGNGW